MLSTVPLELMTCAAKAGYVLICEADDRVRYIGSDAAKAWESISSDPEARVAVAKATKQMEWLLLHPHPEDPAQSVAFMTPGGFLEAAHRQLCQGMGLATPQHRGEPHETLGPSAGKPGTALHISRLLDLILRPQLYQCIESFEAVEGPKPDAEADANGETGDRSAHIWTVYAVDQFNLHHPVLTTAQPNYGGRLARALACLVEEITPTIN